MLFNSYDPRPGFYYFGTCDECGKQTERQRIEDDVPLYCKCGCESVSIGRDYE